MLWRVVLEVKGKAPHLVPRLQSRSLQLLLAIVFKHLNNSIRCDPRKTYKHVIDWESEL